MADSSFSLSSPITPLESYSPIEGVHFEETPFQGFSPFENNEAEESSEDDDGWPEEEESADEDDEKQLWRIDHSKGEHKLTADKLGAMVSAPGFDGNKAIEMLQRLHSLNYGSKASGSGPASAATCGLGPRFFFDLFIVVGRPLRPITQPSAHFFDNMRISFRHWQAPYSAKHVHGLPFELTHRTFQLASAATRETWYIVMHPVVAPVTELPRSRRQKAEQQRQALASSALLVQHAERLAAYIKQLFLSGELLGLGVEPTWRLNGPEEKRLTANTWTTFQRLFIEGWSDFARENDADPFWHQNQPAFHAYDYGGNIPIEVATVVQFLPREGRLRRDENTDDEEDTSFVRSPSSEGPPPPQDIDYEPFYSDGLHHLRAELEAKYLLDNIAAITYAVAVDLHCFDFDGQAVSSSPTWCLLADRSMMWKEFRGRQPFTFYPLAFHPSYGNVSSHAPPAFLLEGFLAVMQENMSFQNDGADILHCGYFQAYSNVKRVIRHDPRSLLASQGVATAAMALSEPELAGASRCRTKQQKLLEQLRGQRTPEDPDASKPFMREERSVQVALDNEDFPFRMEQVLSVRVDRLSDANRTFSTVLRPIFQFMRFYINDRERFVPLLRVFRPDVFPGVLAAFARIFGLAMDEMLLRFDAAGPEGLGAAFAEGVAVLDRLGNYCFTGKPHNLMPSVMGPLGVMDALRHCAWPYVDPRVLDLRTGGQLDVDRWPRDDEGRPILMHVRALGFHHGAAVAARHQVYVWMKEFGGGAKINGPSGAARYVDRLFREMWIPQMMAFLQHHLDHARRQAWEQSSEPFSRQSYEPILALLTPEGRVSHQSRSDYCSRLYGSCLSGSSPAEARLFCSKRDSWHGVLRTVIQQTDPAAVSRAQWVSALAGAMAANNIECAPGWLRGKITCGAAIRLVGKAAPTLLALARPGSLKRNAMEAELRLSQPAKKRRVDLGYAVPFTGVPAVIVDAFRAQEKYFLKGDRAVLEHYQVARNCLEDSLGDPRCDLLLVIALTFASCSVTPEVAPGASEFTAASRKRDPAILAVNLVTRMLWFLRPDYFPWKADAGQVLRVSEMTKKVEHKGVNNRILKQLGWVQVTRGSRATPRNDEVRIRDADELVAMRRELLSMRRDPDGFIGRVFGSADPIWVERCAQMIRDE